MSEFYPEVEKHLYPLEREESVEITDPSAMAKAFEELRKGGVVAGRWIKSIDTREEEKGTVMTVRYGLI